MKQEEGAGRGSQVSCGLALAGPSWLLFCPGAVGKAGLVPRMTRLLWFAHRLGSSPGGVGPARHSGTDLDIWLQEMSCSSFQDGPLGVGVGEEEKEPKNNSSLTHFA